jgi:hypothetical protein
MGKKCYDDAHSYQYSNFRGYPMRTIIDLPESQLAALAELERSKNVSRAELIRQAVAQYVRSNVSQNSAFGAWKKSTKPAKDGVTTQRKLRSEWDR